MRTHCYNCQRYIVIEKVSTTFDISCNDGEHPLLAEYSQAVSFVERALFTYERAFMGAFTFTTGQNRLDFDCVENRPFFLALHRQVMYTYFTSCSFFDSHLLNIVTFSDGDAPAPPLNLLVFCTPLILGTTPMVHCFIWTISLSKLA
jgi:hypothetical protein